MSHRVEPGRALLVVTVLALVLVAAALVAPPVEPVALDLDHLREGL